VAIPRVPTRLEHGGKRRDPLQIPLEASDVIGALTIRSADREAIIALVPQGLRMGMEGFPVQKAVRLEVTDHVPALGEAKVDQLLGGVPTVEEDIDTAIWGKEGFDLGEHLLRQGELAVEVQPGMRGAIAVQPADGALSQVGAPVDRVS
jgi:hypothetical protein